MIPRLSLAVFVLYVTTQVVYAATMQTILLKHRTADQVILLLEPLIDENIRLAGDGFTLIVNATPDQLEEITQLLKQIDLAPRQYLIELRRRELGDGQSYRAGVEVRAEGKVTSADINVYSTEQQDQLQQTQTVRATEGMASYVDFGELFATPVQLFGFTQGIQWQQLRNGFYVIPRSNSEQNVVLTISNQSQRLATSRITNQQLDGEVRLPINQWQLLAQSSQQSQARQSGRLSTETERQSSFVLEVRVSVITQ